MQDILFDNRVLRRGGKQVEIQSASRLNQGFPAIVCINLDRRPDRWRRFQEQAERLNIKNVIRFTANDGIGINCPPHWSDSPGAYGCLLSHLEIIKWARGKGLPSILILEDDVVFDDSLESRFAAYMR